VTYEPIEFPVEGLVDDSVRLRLAADSDRAAFVEACQDPAIQRYTTVPERYGDVNAREFARQAALGFVDGTAVTVVIVDAATDELLGTVALRRIQAERGRWSVGYWVAPWARGKGVATAAVRLISRFGFDELEAARIDLLAEPENVASVRVAEGAGFRRERLLRDEIVIKGEAHDVFLYSLLPGEPS
jgi:RimJ/RimL family protein N-acetyltransferase